jgi:hypothetical protein
MGNFGETPAGRGGFCLCHPGCSLPMIALLRSHQGASGKIRLARVGDNECQHDLACPRNETTIATAVICKE